MLNLNLRNVLSAANDAYHNAASIISDLAYDELSSQLAAEDGVENDEVGALPDFGRCALPERMPSLDKVAPDDVRAWMKSACAIAPGSARPQMKSSCAIASDKLDGVSCLAVFDAAGEPRLYTRGDGVTGRDISHLRRYVTNLPQGVPRWTVRGEIVIPRRDFRSGFAERFSTARNLVSGVVNALSPDAQAASRLRFVAYQLLERGATPSDQFARLQSAGFEVVWHCGVDADADHAALLQSRRTDSPYDVDGLVYLADAPFDGVPARGNPKTAVAVKSRSLLRGASTNVTAVEWQETRNRRLVPVVVFEPVELDGVTVSRATGHNAKRLQEAGIDKGAIVYVVRGGDVIPYIDSVLKKAEAVELPPDARWDGPHLVATGGNDDAAAAAALRHFFATVRVMGVGEKTCHRLVELGVRRPADLVRHREAAESLCSGTQDLLERTRSALRACDPAVLLAAAGGPDGRGVGSAVLASILEVIAPAELTSADADEVVRRVPGVGPVRALAAIRCVRHAASWLEGVYDMNAIESAADAPPDRKKATESVCFSGFRDSELEARLRAAGVRVTQTVTSATSALLVRSLPTSSTKADRAKALGVPIATVEDYVAAASDSARMNA